MGTPFDNQLEDMAREGLRKRAELEKQALWPALLLNGIPLAAMLYGGLKGIGAWGDLWGGLKGTLGEGFKSLQGTLGKDNAPFLHGVVKPPPAGTAKPGTVK
jgi:hypothetical protein